MTPHPNDKAAQVRELRKKLRRAENHIPNQIVLDSLARAALEAARARIEELEEEVQTLKTMYAAIADPESAS